MNFTSRHALRGWSSSTWTSLFNRCHSTSAGTGTFTEVIRKHLGGFLTQGRWLVFHRMNLLRGWKGESLTYFCWVVFWGGEDVPSPMLLRNRWERVGAKNYTASTSGEFLSGFFWGSFPLFFYVKNKKCNRSSSPRWSYLFGNQKFVVKLSTEWPVKPAMNPQPLKLL